MNSEQRAASCHSNPVSHLELLEDKLTELLAQASKPVSTNLSAPASATNLSAPASATNLSAVSAEAIAHLKKWTAAVPDLLKRIREQKRRLVAEVVSAQQLAQAAEEGVKASAEHRRWSAPQDTGNHSSQQCDYFRKLLLPTGLSGRGNLDSLLSAFMSEEALQAVSELSLNEYWLCRLVKQAVLTAEKSEGKGLPLDAEALEAAREELCRQCLADQAVPRMATSHRTALLSSWTARLALALDPNKGASTVDFSSGAPGKSPNSSNQDICSPPKSQPNQAS